MGTAQTSEDYEEGTFVPHFGSTQAQTLDANVDRLAKKWKQFLRKDWISVKIGGTINAIYLSNVSGAICYCFLLPRTKLISRP